MRYDTTELQNCKEEKKKKERKEKIKIRRSEKKYCGISREIETLKATQGRWFTFLRAVITKIFANTGLLIHLAKC